MVEENRAPQLWPLAIVLGVLLWIFTMTGGNQIFVNEMLSEAYDSQAEHLLKGDPGVDGGAIRHESMIVNGKTRMYFGPFPAFVRIPLNYVYPAGRGNWSRLCGFGAAMIALAAFTGLVRMYLRSSQLSPRWRSWVGNTSLVGFAFGSPLLLLLGNLSIYDEAIVWGLAWSLASLYFACRSRQAEGAALTRSLIAFSLCAGATLLSRATFGAPLVLIAPLLALRLLRKDQIRNLAALFLPLGAAVVFYLALNYAKFGNFRGMDLEHHVNTPQRDFARQHGLFQFKRVPYSFADYFILRRPQFKHEPPYIKAGREPYSHPTLYVMPFTETYSSLIWCSSWIILGSMIGVAWLLWPGGSDRVDQAIAAILFVQVVGILTFMGLAQRYLAEFFPFLVFVFLFFLRRGRAVFHLRYALIVLVAASVVINSLATVSWMLESDMNVPPQTRAKWTEFVIKLPSY
jgi:hypothetical protein